MQWKAMENITLFKGGFQMGESTPCYPPVMGEFKKGWWIPPNPQQEKTLLHLELPLTPSLTKVTIP